MALGRVSVAFFAIFVLISLLYCCVVAPGTLGSRHERLERIAHYPGRTSLLRDFYSLNSRAIHLLAGTCFSSEELTSRFSLTRCLIFYPENRIDFRAVAPYWYNSMWFKM